MSVDPLRRQFRALRDEADRRELDRYVNLSVLLQDHSGAPLWQAGGIWDREERRYGGWERPHVIRLRKSQQEAAQLLLWWLQERIAGRPRDYCAEFLIGDRGGGKTAMLVISAGLFLLDFPKFAARPDATPAILFLVSKSHSERTELDREWGNFFPFDGTWYRYSEYKGHVYTWINGATVKNLSADDEDATKQGRVDFVGFNEAAKFSKKVPAFGLGRIKDQGGFGLFTSNKPSQRSRWILNWHEKSEEAKEAGADYPVRFCKIASAENDTLDKRTADQVDRLIQDIAPEFNDANMDALFDPLEPHTYPLFSVKPGGNVAPPPDLGDITREFSKKIYASQGHFTRDGFEFIGSSDYQYNPGIVGTFWKVYGTLEAPIFWCVDELEVPHASEEQYLDEVADSTGYTPANTLWTGDNTGQGQDSRHDPKARTSFEVWRARGWKIIPNVKPNAPGHHPNNVRVERRVRLTNYLIEKAASLPGDQRLIRHLMISDKCPRLIKSFVNCENRVSGRNGMPYPAHPFSHLTDTAGYLAWLGWPKPKGASKGPAAQYEAVQVQRREVW